jgi:hypothetical protein
LGASGSALPVAAYLSEQEGIRDLQKIVETQQVPSTWYFVPRNNLWIEAGRGQNTPEGFQVHALNQ